MVTALKRLPRPRAIATIFLGASLTLVLSPARAGYTQAPVAQGRHSTPQSRILSRVLGGHFAADGLNYTNGTITAARVEDTGPGATDQVWSEPLTSAAVVFSRHRQSFGVINGDGSYTNLFDVRHQGYRAIGGTGGRALGVSGPYEFARTGAGGMVTSNAAQNPGALDHLVTYEINGNGPASVHTWLLFWEDRAAQNRDNMNYADLAVSIQTRANQSPRTAGGAAPVAAPILIPLPPAAWTGLSGLIGLAAVGVVKRARRVRQG